MLQKIFMFKDVCWLSLLLTSFFAIKNSELNLPQRPSNLNFKILDAENNYGPILKCIIGDNDPEMSKNRVLILQSWLEEIDYYCLLHTIKMSDFLKGEYFSYGKSFLHHLVRANNVPCVQLFLKFGAADLNDRDFYGNRPFDCQLSGAMKKMIKDNNFVIPAPKIAGGRNRYKKNKRRGGRPQII